jgi:asparagine synthase (glutamine-hydrolysing)
MPLRLQTYNHIERSGVERVLEPEFLKSIDQDHPRRLLEETYRGARAESMLNRTLALDLRFTLADNDLPKVSLMSEAAGVEVAYPLLDDDVIDFARRVPPRLQLRGKRLRWLWKHAWRDFLPHEVLNKAKQGFGLPVGIWLRDHAALREMAWDCLKRLETRGIVRPDYIDGLIHRHRDEHATYYGVMIWTLMMLELWFRVHVEGETGGPGSLPTPAS